MEIYRESLIARPHLDTQKEHQRPAARTQGPLNQNDKLYTPAIPLKHILPHEVVYPRSGPIQLVMHFQEDWTRSGSTLNMNKSEL